jgi:hypothetical protein
MSAGLFSPGNPTAFQCNYLAGQALLCELEGLATSRATVERLRASSAAAGWAKRWNLPVYFSLVYQDIAGELWGQGASQCLFTKGRESSAAAGWAKRRKPPVYFSLADQDISGVLRTQGARQQSGRTASLPTCRCWAAQAPQLSCCNMKGQ